MENEKRTQFNNGSLKLAYYQAVCKKAGLPIPPEDNKELVDLLSKDQALFGSMAIGGSYTQFVKRYNELVDHVSKLTGTRSDGYASIILNLFGVNDKKQLTLENRFTVANALKAVEGDFQRLGKLLSTKIMFTETSGYALKQIDSESIGLVTYNKSK